VAFSDTAGLMREPNIDDQANPFGWGSSYANYTEYFNTRFPNTMRGAKKLLLERAKKKICANMYSSVVPGLSGGAEDIDITPDMGRFGDQPQDWYEENVKIGNFEIKTDEIYVFWDDPQCSLCYSFNTTMYVLENAGDNRLPGFGERPVRMGEWPLSASDCCKPY
jgi:hypothetical protein